MGEEVKMSDYDAIGDGDGTGGEEDRVLDWEIGLPSGEDLPSLSRSLIPTELALAFSIAPEPARTLDDVNRTARNTVSTLRHGSRTSSSTATEEEEVRVGSSSAGSDPKKQKKSDGGGIVAAVAPVVEEEMESLAEGSAAKMMKRPRLVWTPQLHKRFIEVVAHLGIDKAVPKTIMQLMNVEGLTRENVASHLQKYRLYLKRMDGGLTTEVPSSSDKLFSSTPIPPQSFHRGGDAVQANGGGGGHMGIPIPPVPYAAPPGMMPMPVFGQMGMQGHHHHHHNHGHDHYYQNHLHHGGGYESNPYTVQQLDWPENKFASVAPCPPVGGGSNKEK